MTIIDLSKDTIESAKKRYSYQAQSKDHHRYDYNNNNDDNDNDDIDYHNQQPREIRKSVRALHIMHSHVSREIITDIVTHYCKEHSTQKDDNEIVKNINNDFMSCLENYYRRQLSDIMYNDAGHDRMVIDGDEVVILDHDLMNSNYHHRPSSSSSSKRALMLSPDDYHVLDKYDDDGDDDDDDDCYQQYPRRNSLSSSSAAAAAAMTDYRNSLDTQRRRSSSSSSSNNNNGNDDNDIIFTSISSSKKSGRTPTSSSSSSSRSSHLSLRQGTIFHNRIENEEVEDEGDIVEVVVISACDEILNIFPDADLTHLNALLLTHGQSIQATVQYMLEKGYEKRKRDVVTIPSSSSSSSTTNYSNHHSSSSRHDSNIVTYIPEPLHDYTSNNWITTISYRMESLSELCRNYPFLKVKSIETIFAVEAKYHFYHAMKYIDMSIGGIGSVCTLMMMDDVTTEAVYSSNSSSSSCCCSSSSSSSSSRVNITSSRSRGSSSSSLKGTLNNSSSPKLQQQQMLVLSRIQIMALQNKCKQTSSMVQFKMTPRSYLYELIYNGSIKDEILIGRYGDDDDDDDDYIDCDNSDNDDNNNVDDNGDDDSDDDDNNFDDDSDDDVDDSDDDDDDDNSIHISI